MSLLDRVGGNLDFDALASYLEQEFQHSFDPAASEFAWEVRELKKRLERGVQPNDMDIDTFLAADIVKRLRQVLRARPEEAIVIRAQNVMQQLDILQAPLKKRINEVPKTTLPPELGPEDFGGSDFP